MLSKKKTAALLLAFSILEACASTPKAARFDGKWEFCEISPMRPPLACLAEPDVQKLRALLLQCTPPARK